MSSAYGLRTFGIGLMVWIGWRVFAPAAVTYVTLYWSVVICFVVPLTLAVLWPQVLFELGQRAMRLYEAQKHWLIMRDLPVASRSAWRRVRAEQARRKVAALPRS